MRIHSGSTGRSLARRFVPALLAVLATGLLTAGAAMASGPGTIAAQTVNWKWLAAGLGGVVVLLVLMYLLQRGIQRVQQKQQAEKMAAARKAAPARKKTRKKR